MTANDIPGDTKTVRVDRLRRVRDLLMELEPTFAWHGQMAENSYHRDWTSVMQMLNAWLDGPPIGDPLPRKNQPADCTTCEWGMMGRDCWGTEANAHYCNLWKRTSAPKKNAAIAWLMEQIADESGYQERVWPIVKAALERDGVLQTAHLPASHGFFPNDTGINHTAWPGR